MAQGRATYTTHTHTTSPHLLHLIPADRQGQLSSTVALGPGSPAPPPSMRASSSMPPCSRQWTASSPALMPSGLSQVVSSEGGITPAPTPCHGRQVVESAFPCSRPQGWLTHTPWARASPIVLPRQGAEPAPLSNATSKGQNQLTRCQDPGSALPAASGDHSHRGRRYLPGHLRADEWLGQLSLALSLGLAYLLPSARASKHCLCCPGTVQCPLS